MNPKWFLRSLCTNTDFDIDKAVTTVGRQNHHDLACLNFAVSREHAILLVEDGNLYVQAQQTMNGTWLNGSRLKPMEKVKLSFDDFLCFGYAQHPDCKEGDDHYYYKVMFRNTQVHTSSDLLKILEDKDSIETGTVKKEPEDPPIAIEYSNNEEFVIINDDDNFEFASSQIFNEKSFVIKAEKEECIEISDSENEDGDVFKLIGPCSPIEDCLDDENANGDISPNNIDTLHHDENQNITLDGQNKQNDAEKNDVQEQEAQKETSKDEIVNQENKKLRSNTIIDRSFILKSKYSKPAVIPPHVEDNCIKKRRKSISKEKKNDAKKQKVENNQIIENLENVVKPKKSGRSRGRPRKPTENGDVDQPVNKRQSMPRQENMEVDPPISRKKSIPKKRTASKLNSEITNNIEIKQNFVIPRNKPSASNVKEHPRRNGLRQKNGCNKDPVKENVNKENTVVLTSASENLTGPQKMSFRNVENITPSTSKVVSEPKDPRKRNGVYNGASNVADARTVNDNDLEGILRCPVNHNVRSKPVDLRNQYPLLNKPSCGMIFSVLGWNTNWLKEQQEQSVPPPIIRNDVVKMCTLFNTYADYCNVVKPFIILELWDNLTQGSQLSADGKKRFRTSISEVHKYNHYQILKCIAYTNDKDKRILNRPKEGDVIVINIGVRHAGQAAVKCMFAFVVSCRSHWLKPTDYIYKDLLAGNNNITLQLDIHLLLKPFPEEILLAKFVDATIISSITSILRECDAVMHMEKSPISNLILNPKIDNFKILRNDNLVIDKLGLCEKQVVAIQDACSLCVGNRPGLYLIQGPPGTGKTTVIQHIIENLVRAKDHIRILVVAPSNATVDGIVRKLSAVKKRDTPDAKQAYRSDMVRLGIYDSVSNDLKHYFLDSVAKRRIVQQILHERPEVKMDYFNLKQRRHDLYLKLEKEKRSTNKNVAEQLFKELQSVDKQINDFASDYYTDSHYRNMLHWTKKNVVMKAKIICTTLNSCTRLEEYKMNIDCCIVDEASQSKETETLIPLSLGIQKMILVGDPQQLPAVTLSKYAKDLEYGQSLFARMKKAFASKGTEPITVLNTQFRMHPEICMYPNKTFYRGALKTASKCNSRGGLDGLVPYYVLNLNIRTHQANGYYNKYEIDCVLKLLEAVHTTIRNKPDNYYTVGVITPYNSQKRDLLTQIEKIKLPKMNITVNTVDSFQGAEKDIIILSCVRVRANSFLNDKQRLNVALTRARRVLYVVGTNPLFDTCPTLQSLKANAESRNLYLNVYDVSVLLLKTLIEKRT